MEEDKKGKNNIEVIDFSKKKEQKEDDLEFDSILKFNDFLTDAINEGLELNITTANVALCLAAAANDLAEMAADEWADYFINEDESKLGNIFISREDRKALKKKEAKKLITQMMIDLLQKEE